MACCDNFNPGTDMVGATKVNFGQNQNIYCGKLTPVTTRGLRIGVMEESDLVNVGLMDPNFIQNARTGTLIDYGWKFRFEVKSKATGGLGICECGFDPSPFDRVHFRRQVGGLPRLYIHARECPREFIGTELEPVFYTPNTPTKSPNVDNDYTRAIVSAMVNSVGKNFSTSAVLGIKGDSQREMSHFYGIIAQAWFAAQNATYNSAKYTVDSTEFTDTISLAVKIGGEQKIFTLESTVTGESGYDAIIEGVLATATYANAQALFNAVSVWINGRTLASGQRVYEAQSFGYDVFITHKHVAEILDVRFQVIEVGATPNWQASPSCDKVTYTVIQQPMPIDERPIILPYTPLNQFNAYDVLHDSLHLYSMQVRQEDLNEYDINGNIIGPLMVKMFCDKNIYTMFKAAQRRQENPMDLEIQTQNGVSQPIEMIPLTQLEGTGLFFFTTERNMLGLTDIMAGNNAFIAQAPEYLDNIAGTINYAFEMNALVTLKNFRTFGVNLGCNHPYLQKLIGHTADNDTACCIPCLHPEVLKCAIPATTTCNVTPGFCVKIVAVDADAGEYKLVIESTATGFDLGEDIDISYTGTFNNGVQTVLSFSANEAVVEIPFYTSALNGLSAMITQSITNGSCTTSVTKTIGTAPDSDFTPTNIVVFGFDVVIAAGPTLAIVGQSDLGLDAFHGTAAVIYTITDGDRHVECITVNAGEDVAAESIATIGSNTLDYTKGLTITATYRTVGGLGGNGDGSQSCGSVDTDAIDMQVVIPMGEVVAGTYPATHP